MGTKKSNSPNSTLYHGNEIFFGMLFELIFHAREKLLSSVIIQVTLKLKLSRDRRKGSVWKAYINY